VWIDLFNTYLPRRYHTIKGHIADSNGKFSEQIDVIIHDRHFTPLIFTFKDVQVIPAESVYAVFESKQQIDKENVDAAKQKLASVRRLHRTNGQVVGKGAPTEPGELFDIMGGVLALDSNWSDPLGPTLMKHLKDEDPQQLLDIGCIASEGIFVRIGTEYDAITTGRHATRFLFRLTEMLRVLGTAPVIEMHCFEPYLEDAPTETKD